MQLVVALLIFTTIWAANGVTLLTTFTNLRNCLKMGNFSQSNFIPRYQTSRTYLEVNYQWNTFNYIEPLAYILPETTAQVQTAIKCTRLRKLPISIKGGGHSYPKYSFGNSSSVVIDLRKMDYVYVAYPRALVGPGAVMGQVYYYSSAVEGDYITPGPHCLSVGFGGAALGGGYGYMSKHFGLMIDNIVGFEMVTADGDVLQIDNKRHEDLFWALRGGGGGNFGIVTEFRTKVHEAPPSYNYITLRYPLDQFTDAFDAFQKFCSKNVKKLVYAFMYFSRSGIIIVLFDTRLSQHTLMSMTQEFPKSSEASNRTFEYFLEVALQTTPPSNITVETVAHLADYARHDTPQSFVKTKSYFTKKVVSQAKVRKLGKVFMRIPHNTSMTFRSFGGAIDHVLEDDTPFVHRNSIHTSELKIGSNDADTLTWVEEFKEAMSILDDGESYQNIMDDTLPDYLQRYYGKNLLRLRQIKTKYDPTNYFKFPQSIPPL